MDELNEQEYALQHDLTYEGEFDDRYSMRGRFWFAKRMILHYRASAISYAVSTLRAPCLEAIRKATAFSRAFRFEARDIIEKTGKVRRPEFNMRTVQIVYGAIGNHPEVFLENAASLEYLEFIRQGYSRHRGPPGVEPFKWGRSPVRPAPGYRRDHRHGNRLKMCDASHSYAKGR